MTIAIIDYGMGNLYSVAKAIERVSAKEKVIITGDPKEIVNASRVVFPGQGSMPSCISEIERRGLTSVLHKVASDRPFLGICVGLQLLFSHSEEGNQNGLGILDGKVKLLPTVNQCKIPHMGWNKVYQQFNHQLWQGIEDQSRFYFVHSYYVAATNPDLIAAKTIHSQEFTSAIIYNNLMAVQFHPEKSSENGLQLLANFVNWLA